MIFRQFVDDDLGCASYLVGDDTAGVVVVDPAYAIEQYVDEARRLGTPIVAVLETHTHADHVSGHGRLALEHGLPVHVHPAADPEFPFEPLHDGQELELGAARIRVIHTPGHRPEHCAFLVNDELVLTGDSLFVGDAARPDLAVAAREGAEGLFHSLRRLAELPEGVKVYPGHVAGSLCGANMSSDRSSTIGAERRLNPSLSFNVVEEFVAAAVTSAPRPPNMERIVALNRGPFVGGGAPLATLESADGCVVLDVRDPHEFVAGHAPGALNVPLSSSGFGTKAGFLLHADERVAVYAASRADAEEAARRLRAVGFLESAGYLEHAPQTDRLAPIALDELEQLLDSGAVEVLDVREKDERDGGYIAGSRHVPYRLLRAGDFHVCDGDRPVVTICNSGARAAIAASVLAAQGIEARPVLDAGVPEWQARGRSTVAFRRCGST